MRKQVMQQVYAIGFLVLTVSPMSRISASRSVTSDDSDRSAVNRGADSLVTPTIDTGAFAPGNKDFSRFTSPMMCVGAAHHAAEVSRRGVAVHLSHELLRDTAPERDTLPLEAMAIAKRCGTRFTVAGTAPLDLPGLFTLSLLAKNDAQARAVVEQQLTFARDAKARQAVLEAAAQGYIDAEPGRLEEAAWAAAKADTLAHAEHTNSLPAHLPLLLAARQSYDRPRMLREARRLIALGHTLDFNAIKYEDVPLIRAWRQVFAAAFYDHPDSLLALSLQAKTDLRRFPLGQLFPVGVPYTLDQMFDFNGATLVQVRDFLLPFNPERYSGGNVLPPVDAPYWYPAKPDVWPPKGHVSLVLYGGWVTSCAREDWNLLDFPLRRECLALHTFLRQWTEQHGSQGFALTLVARTLGEAMRSVPIAPKVEADSLNWFYREYLKLPVTTVAVVPRTVVSQIPQEADGRRWMADTTRFGRRIDDNTRGNQNSGFIMLYDRNGTLLYASPWNLENALLHALIVRALKAPAGSGGGQ